MTDDLEMVPMMNASNHETVPGGKTPISLVVVDIILSVLKA